MAHPSAKLRTLEALRGLAALTVALEHATWTVRRHPLLPFHSETAGFEVPGLPGIEFFFVLSGFVMVLVHAGDFGRADRILPFLWRRACRIYPLYWLVLTAMVWQFWSILTPSPWLRIGWYTLWPFTTDNLLAVAWTLRQEMVFYLMLALCMLPRAGFWILAAWVGATAAANLGLFPWPQEPHLALLVNGMNEDFFMGLLMGALYRKGTATPRQCLAILALGLIGVTYELWATRWATIPGPTQLRALAGLSYGAIIFACGRWEQAGVLRPGRWAVWLGVASYPLYLSHVMVYDYLTRPFGSSGLAAAIGPSLTLVSFVVLAIPVGLLLGLADRLVQAALRRLWRKQAAIAQEADLPRAA